MSAADAIRADIHANGPIGFDAFMEHALYGPGGFYADGSGPGRRGADFLTSVEIGPLFGAVVARALDAWWDQFGRPSTFPVVEAGAGRGALAATIRRAEPQCAAALRYVLVERAAPARALAREALGDDADIRSDLPTPGELGDVGVVIANELLDNLVFKVVERGPNTWHELRVVDDADHFAFAPAAGVAQFDRLDAAIGARVPWHTGAAEWLADVGALFTHARVLLIDYGTETTDELAARPWRTWLRTYRDHGAGQDPLRNPGAQDITCDVAFDQLNPDTLMPQADWLRSYGIAGLVDAARATWTERAAIGDLTALAARSRVNEADALLDPTGPGGFLVAQWVT